MRLDNFLVHIGLFETRTKAKQSIERGEIYIDGKQVVRPAYDILETNRNKIERICEDSFVSLGGYKLKKAITDFSLDVNGLIACDVGASTGGFTDCLLKHGAAKVYAVDLNDDLLHETLKRDDRVTSIIKNAKDLDNSDFEHPIDLIVADLSFISITCVIEVFSKLITDGKKLLILIKPQFETGERRKFKNGIIRDKKIQYKAIESVINCAKEFYFSPIAFTTAPLKTDKNLEFLMLFEKNGISLIEYKDLNF